MAKKRNNNSNANSDTKNKAVEEVKADVEKEVVTDSVSPSDSVDIEETKEDVIPEPDVAETDVAEGADVVEEDEAEVVDSPSVAGDTEISDNPTAESDEETGNEEKDAEGEPEQVEGTPSDAAPKSEDLPKETIPEEPKTINTAEQVVATDPVAAPTSTANTSKTAKSTNAYVAGQGVKLVNEPLYNIAGSATPFKHITGVFYIYDDKCIQGRYRITDQRSKVRKGINNVIGYIDPK